MSERTPLILILLKFPVLILLKVSQYGGTILYFPTYGYFFIIKKFIENPRFETDARFYALFFLPRALLVAGGFALSISQALLIYNIVIELTDQEGLFLQGVTLLSTLFGVSFLYRRGYKQIFEEWKFTQLRSVLEHLQILSLFVYDMLSVILTLLVIIMVVRIGTIWNYHKAIKQGRKTQYLPFIFKMTYYSLFELIGLAGYMFLHVFRWRLSLTKELMKKVNYKIKELLVVYQQVFHTILEIILSPILFLIMLHPSLREQALLNIRTFPIDMLKRIVFNLLMEILTCEAYYPLFLIASILSIFKIPLIVEVHQQNKNRLEYIQQKISAGEEKNLKMYLDINSEIEKRVSLTRGFYLTVFFSTIFDVIALVFFIPQFILVLPHKINISIMNERGLKFNYLFVLKEKLLEINNYPNLKKQNITVDSQNKMKKNQSVLEIHFFFISKFFIIFSSELSQTLTDHHLDFSSKIDNQVNNQESFVLLIKQLITLFPFQVGFFQFLIDLLFFAIGLVSLIALWRIIDYLSPEFKKLSRSQKRWMAFKTLWYGLVDYVVFSLFIISLIFTYPIHFSYVNESIKAIAQKQSKTTHLPNKHESFLSSPFIFISLQQFIWNYLVHFFSDLLLLPFYAINLITVYPTRIYLSLLNEFKIQPYQFNASRLMMFIAFKCLLYDFINLILSIFVYLPYYRLSKFKKFQADLQSSVKYQKPESPPPLFTDSQISLAQLNIEKSNFYINRKITFKLTLITSLFTLIDAVTLLPRTFIFITYLKEKRYKQLLADRSPIKEVNPNSLNIELVLKYEVFRAKLVFKTAIKLVLVVLASLICLVLGLCAFWRFPYIIMIFRKPKTFIAQLTKKERITSPRHIALVFINVLFAAILDIIYSPLIIMSAIINPLLLFNYIRYISYRYYEHPSINLYQQVYEHKRILFHLVWINGIKDLLFSIKMLLIGLTMLRIPFFILVVKKNNLTFIDLFYEYYLMQKPYSVHSKFAQQKLEQIPINKDEPRVDLNLPELKAILLSQQRISLKLTLRRCVNVTFIELLKDIPIFFMSVLTVALFPWRLFSVIRLWHESLARIPQFQDESGRITLKSNRSMHSKLLLRCLVNDLPCIIMNLVLAASIYKIPKMFYLLLNLIHKTFTPSSVPKQQLEVLSSFDYRKELLREIKRLLQEIQTVSQFVIIHILRIRVKSLKRRLTRYQAKIDYREKLRLYQLSHPAEDSQNPNKACFSNVSFNVYSKIAEFLDAKDLAAMQRTNRKFAYFTSQELLWEHLFSQKYVHQPHQFYAETFRDKCIEGYKFEVQQQRGQPISEEEKDEIIGWNHIIFDEYLLSILELPRESLRILNIVKYAMPKAPMNDGEYLIQKQASTQPFYLQGMSHVFTLVIPQIYEIGSSEQLKKQIPVIQTNVAFMINLIRFIEKYTYFTTLVPYHIIRSLNAGEVRMYHIDRIQRINIVELNSPAHQFPRAKAFIHYFLQFFSFIFLVLYHQTLIFGCFEFSYFYLEGSFLDSLFWPSPILLPFLIATSGFSFYTEATFFKDIFIFYRPFYLITYCIRKIFWFFGVILKKIYWFISLCTRKMYSVIKTILRTVAKPLYDKLLDLLSYLGKMLKSLARTLRVFKHLFRGVLTLIQLIRDKIRLGKNTYYDSLKKVYQLSIKFGLIGDLIFTIFTLFWMTWPIIIAYYYNYTSLWISASAISFVLIVKGYLLIKKIAQK